MRQLRHLEASTDFADVEAVLLEDGGVIVDQLLSGTVVEAIAEECAPYLATRQSGYGNSEFDDFYGRRTKRINGLVRRSPTFASRVLVNPLLLRLCDDLLLPYANCYWLNLSELISIGPGELAQELHRDDLNWPYVGAIDGILTQVEALIAVSEYTAEMGATLVVPGSHRLAPTSTPTVEDAVPAEMQSGSALLYLNRTWHGGGHNSTTDLWRTGLHVSYVVDWLTPEEAAALSLTSDEAAQLPAAARRLLGWAAHDPLEHVAREPSSPLWQLDPLDSERLAGAFLERS